MSTVRFIAGSGRSGTTWIQDALAAANRLRPVFEPLNPFASQIGRLYAHRAIRSDESHDDLREFLQGTFAGSRERLWTQYRRQRNWLIPDRKVLSSPPSMGRFGRRWLKFLREAPALASMARWSDPIVKCIFANLMLDWLHLNCHCQILFVVRHPGAVIESELRTGWDPKYALNQYRSDPVLHSLTQDRYRSLLSRSLTPIEALAAKWVIENQPVVERQLSSHVAVVFYELLAASDDASWRTVQSVFRLGNAPDARYLARPSQQSAPRGSSGYAFTLGAASWMSSLSDEQRSEIQGVLDSVGFATYSMSNAVPVVGGVPVSGATAERVA